MPPGKNPDIVEMFERWGKAPPSHEPHGTEAEIRENLSPLKGKNWRMEGNMLTCDVAGGTHSQALPTNIICTGSRSDGMPILKRIA